MAKFSYENYVEQQKVKQSGSAEGAGLGPQVHFLNEFLKNDGDVVVVRFPYHSMNDILFETTHAITFPGKRFPSRVRCEGDNCPMCASGVKVDIRFLVKAIAYIVDDTTSEVKLVNTVWDRPSAFADIDIKNLMLEYGDLSHNLFKIKRNGSGTATRYTTSIITNTAVYNPAVYRADFTELDKVDPTRILTKSYAQYQAALNPEAAQTQHTEKTYSQPAATPTPQPTYAAPVTHQSTLTYVPPTQPAQTYAQPMQQTQPQYQQPAQQPTTPVQPAGQQEVRRNRYQF